MENIIEGNLHIVDYMGYEVNDIGVVIDKRTYTFDQLYFDKSWDRLMPVIIKISNTDEIVGKGLAFTMLEKNYDRYEIWKLVVGYVKNVNERERRRK